MVTVDGIEYKLGQQTSAGVVLALARGSVHIMDTAGNSTFIYPDYGYRFEVPEQEIVASRPESESKAPVTIDPKET